MLAFTLSLPLYFFLAKRVFPPLLGEENESHQFVYSIITFLAGLNNLVGLWYIEQTLAFLIIDVLNILDSDNLSDKYKRDYYVSIKFFRLSACILAVYCETYYMIWLTSILDFLTFINTRDTFLGVRKVFPFKFGIINLNLLCDFLLFSNTLNLMFNKFSFTFNGLVTLLYVINCFTLVYALLCQHLMDLETLYGVEFPSWMERYRFICNKLNDFSYNVF